MIIADYVHTLFVLGTFEDGWGFYEAKDREINTSFTIIEFCTFEPFHSKKVVRTVNDNH